MNSNIIEAINNRTKHTADTANKLSIGILGSSNKAKIGPFFRIGRYTTEDTIGDGCLLDYRKYVKDENKGIGMYTL